MRRAFVLVGGGLLGFATGSVWLVQPVAAFFGPTVVSWSAGNCPAGIYTITSYARDARTTETYSITTANVRLPQSTVSQQFTNLPTGEYQVSATTRENGGQTFGSQTQSVMGQGTGGSFLPPRRRPPDTEKTGIATPRRAVTAARSNLQPSLGAVVTWIDLDWRRLDLVDDDEDGQFDRVRIEFANGRVLTYRIVR